MLSSARLRCLPTRVAEDEFRYAGFSSSVSKAERVGVGGPRTIRPRGFSAVAVTGPRRRPPRSSRTSPTVQQIDGRAPRRPPKGPAYRLGSAPPEMPRKAAASTGVSLEDLASREAAATRALPRIASSPHPRAPRSSSPRLRRGREERPALCAPRARPRGTRAWSRAVRDLPCEPAR